MSILVDRNTRLVVTGLTGREGKFHGLNNRAYGTDLVAGVTPGKGGQDVEGVPVFDTVHDAVAQTGANTAMVFVPPPFAADSILEAADAGIIPASFFSEGNVGLVSRSGTLTYQIGYEIAQRGFGNSSIVGIGGDPIVGSDFIDVMALYEQDPETELIVMCGEIGGDAEERTAEYVAENVSKPVVGYIAGFTAPPGKTMGHAGAIVSGSRGTAAAKAEALEASGVRVGRTPTEVAEIAVEILGVRA
jgi:succinyl-CoA synthetase alpha subunit